MSTNPLEQRTDSTQSSLHTILVVEDEQDIEDFLVQVIELETPSRALCVPDAALLIVMGVRLSVCAPSERRTRDEG